MKKRQHTNCDVFVIHIGRNSGKTWQDIFESRELVYGSHLTYSGHRFTFKTGPIDLLMMSKYDRYLQGRVCHSVVWLIVGPKVRQKVNLFQRDFSEVEPYTKSLLLTAIQKYLATSETNTNWLNAPDTAQPQSRRCRHRFRCEGADLRTRMHRDDIGGGGAGARVIV